MNTVTVLFQSGLEHAEEIPRRSQPLIPIPPFPSLSKKKKNPLLLTFSFNCFKYFSVAWQHSFSFIQASFLLNYVLTDRRQLCRSNN